MIVRVYGSTVGWGSFQVVTHGIASALDRENLLAGSVSYANRIGDVEVGSHGAGAPVGLVCGLPFEIGYMAMFGHEERLFMLAANSTWVPPSIYDAVMCSCTGLLTPSEWSKKVIVDGAPPEFILPVTVVPHGVSECMTPIAKEERAEFEASELFSAFRKPGLSLLHLAESSTERKGTWPLIRAFTDWDHRREAHLTVVVSASQLAVARARLEDEYDEHVDHVSIMGRLNAAPERMRWVYSCFDYVVQPSRGEGFGLCPLEALCCGVPVIVTLCGGHRQWALRDGAPIPGVVPVPFDGQGPAIYDAGGTAPHSSPHAIKESLEQARRDAQQNASDAVAQAQTLSHAWVWSRQIQPWMDDIRRKYQ
jgi:glycosyltransferase involved in cell wall biosynthesis